jgi:hypothetical protein
VRLSASPCSSTRLFSVYVSLYPSIYLSHQLFTRQSVRPFIFDRQFTHSSASATTTLPKPSPETDDVTHLSESHNARSAVRMVS